MFKNQLKNITAKAKEQQKKAVLSAREKERKEKELAFAKGEEDAKKRYLSIKDDLKIAANEGDSEYKEEIYGWRVQAEESDYYSGYARTLIKLLKDDGLSVERKYSETSGGGGSDPYFDGTLYWLDIIIKWDE